MISHEILRAQNMKTVQLSYRSMSLFPQSLRGVSPLTSIKGHSSTAAGPVTSPPQTLMSLSGVPTSPAPPAVQRHNPKDNSAKVGKPLYLLEPQLLVCKIPIYLSRLLCEMHMPDKVGAPQRSFHCFWRM